MSSVGRALVRTVRACRHFERELIGADADA